MRGESGNGSRQSNLVTSFKLATRSLLTSCSKHEFSKSFSSFNAAEQETLHRLFIQLITSLHSIVEDEFESLCLETQVGTTLDTVEQLIEEQSLDSLLSEKTRVRDVACDLSTTKKNEIQNLTDMLRRAEEQNRLLRDQVELLKKGTQDIAGIAEVADKLRAGNLNYGNMQ